MKVFSLYFAIPYLYRTSHKIPYPYFKILTYRKKIIFIATLAYRFFFPSLIRTKKWFFIRPFPMSSKDEIGQTSGHGSRKVYWSQVQVQHGLNTTQFSYIPPIVSKIIYLPAPTTTIFCFTKSVNGRPCALTAPSNPASATPAVP